MTVLSASFDKGGWASFGAFVIVFPAFFYYQVLVQLGYFPALLGGYFTSGAIVALPFLLIVRSRYSVERNFHFPAVGKIFVVFWFLFFISVLVGVANGANANTTGPHFAYLVKFVSLFLIGRFCFFYKNKFYYFLNGLFFGAVLIVLLLASDGGFLRVDIESYEEGDFFVDYQGLALAYIVMLVFSVSGLSLYWRLSLYAVSFPVLFLIGARSEFAGLPILVFIMELCWSRDRLRFLASALAISISGFFIFIYLESYFSDHRMYGVFRLADDLSVNMRKVQIEGAIETIISNPFFGSYASYSPGNYAHNALSAWVDLGLFGFLTFMALVLVPIFVLLRDFRSHARVCFYAQALAFCVFAFVMATFSKSYTYQMIAVASGVFCRYVDFKRFLIRSRISAF